MKNHILQCCVLNFKQSSEIISVLGFTAPRLRSFIHLVEGFKVAFKSSHSKIIGMGNYFEGFSKEPTPLLME